MGKLLRDFIILSVLIVLGALFFIHQQIHAPKTHEAPSLYILKPGTSIRALAQDLEAKDIISSALIFELNARLIDNDAPFQAGEYRILEHTSIQNITDTFQSGKTYNRSIIIVEGRTVQQIIESMHKLDDTLIGEVEELPEEGYLHPQTYFYQRGDTKQELINRMMKKQSDLLNQLWENRAENLPLKTPKEALILASIVEKETGVKAERERVAGVFINRLKKGMKLQSDPTIIYPLSDKYGKMDRPLYRSDWTFDSPYNTYKYFGLPPTAITNPGAASLRAVLNPETHDYLYFVADGTGGHAFGKTLDEHNKNVKKWRAYKKENNIEQ